jgi:hypothetical protein
MVAVQLRARWGVRAPDLAAQIRRALVPMVGGRRIDILVADVGDPPTAQSPLSRVGEVDPVQEGDELEWTATTAAAAPTAASSSAATIPTAAGTQAPLSLG